MSNPPLVLALRPTRGDEIALSISEDGKPEQIVKLGAKEAVALLASLQAVLATRARKRDETPGDLPRRKLLGAKFEDGGTRHAAGVELDILEIGAFVLDGDDGAFTQLVLAAGDAVQSRAHAASSPPSALN